MKNQQYYTVRTVQKSNKIVVERGEFDDSTHKYMIAHFLGLVQPPQELRLFQVLFMLFSATLSQSIDLEHSTDNSESLERGRHGCDRMVVGFTTTYAISAYHH
jgi:hypothetical protein